MKKKLLATAIASALVMPSAFAAQDNAGMHYTSASEGFYTSIRVEYNSATDDSAGSRVGQSWGPSRFGVRGTNDLGGGLEGYYQYEAAVGVDNGSDLNTRIGLVGLRGAFGQVQAGAFWAQNYNWLTGSTDVANTGAGNFQTYGNGIGLFPGRVSNAIEYTSPDLNGFQASGQIIMNSGVDGEGDVGQKVPTFYIVGADANGNGVFGEPGELTQYPDDDFPITSGGIAITSAPDLNVGYFDTDSSGRLSPTDIVIRDRTVNPKDDNDIDAYILNARYGVAGFDVAASYSVLPDGLEANTGRDDKSGYAVKVGYAQDNWYVNAWYAADNASDAKTTTAQDLDGDGNTTDDGEGATVSKSVKNDTEMFSIAGGVSVGKVNVYAMYETQEKAVGYTSTTTEDDYTVFGVQYNLGSRSRVWVDYVARDLDTNKDADDYVAIGLRHDF